MDDKGDREEVSEGLPSSRTPTPLPEGNGEAIDKMESYMKFCLACGAPIAFALATVLLGK